MLPTARASGRWPKNAWRRCSDSAAAVPLRGLRRRLAGVLLRERVRAPAVVLRRCGSPQASRMPSPRLGKSCHGPLGKRPSPVLGKPRPPSRSVAAAAPPSVSVPEPHPLSFGTSVWSISQPTLARLSHPTHLPMPFPPASVVAIPDGNSRNVSDLRTDRFPALARLPGRNAAAAASCTTPQPGGPHKEPPS